MPDNPPSESSVSALEALAEKEKSDDAAPRRARQSKTREASSRPPTARTAPLERRLAQLFTTVALLTSAFDPVCGKTIQDRAEMLAAAWTRAAQQNPKLRAAIEKFLAGGAYGEVAFVTAMTLLPILKHHDLLPFNVERAIEQQEKTEGEPQGESGISDEAKRIIENLPQTVPQPEENGQPRIFIPE